MISLKRMLHAEQKAKTQDPEHSTIPLVFGYLSELPAPRLSKRRIGAGQDSGFWG
jgi:hypothetical protein